MAYFDLDPLLNAMLDVAPSISDLNLSTGRPPQVEIDGALRPVSYAGVERLLPYHTELIAMRLLQGKRDLADKLLRTGSTDLSYSLPRRTRFRVNVFSQRGSYSIVLRVIPKDIPTVEELGLPESVNQIAEERNGIVLVTGPTGSGQVDDPGRGHPQGEPGEADPHHHHRGPGRVPAPEHQGHDQPARGRDRHPDLLAGAAGRPAAGPQGDPGRRDARRGDHLHRPRGLGDRPPGALDPPHHRRGQDHRPHRRASSPRTRSGRSAPASPSPSAGSSASAWSRRRAGAGRPSARSCARTRGPRSTSRRASAKARACRTRWRPAASRACRPSTASSRSSSSPASSTGRWGSPTPPTAPTSSSSSTPRAASRARTESIPLAPSDS